MDRATGRRRPGALWVQAGLAFRGGLWYWLRRNDTTVSLLGIGAVVVVVNVGSPAEHRRQHGFPLSTPLQIIGMALVLLWALSGVLWSCEPVWTRQPL